MMKRARSSSLGDDNDIIDTNVMNSNDAMVVENEPAGVHMTEPSLRASSSRDPSSMTASDAELHVTNALVKSLLLKSNNLLVDFIKDPNFRTFLERVRQYGVPASLFGDDTAIIDKSLMSYKEEVRRYISEVKESWKITGCTMMVYSLNQRKEKLSDLDKDNNVLGFYSPKGFIFFEDIWMNGIGTSPFLTNVKQLTLHEDSDDHIQSCCELVGPNITSLWCVEMRDDRDFRKQSCLRYEIQRMCSRICKGSELLEGLFNKAEQIHQHIVHSHFRNRYYETLKKKELKEFGDASSFVSVILLEDELKTWLSNPIEYGVYLEDAEIEEAINDSEFWIQGRLVQTALNLILEIPDLMDTLVPSAGYLKLAIENVKRELNSCNRPHTPMLDQFWKDLDCELSDLEEYETYDAIQGAAYLNPAYFCGNEDRDLSVTKLLKDIIGFVMKCYVDEVVEEEVHRYILRCSNPFANISQQERENTHPIKLWEEYGHAFPKLQKFAIKVLSLQVTCLCNQVKKHLSELKGADNLILRLNARMMEQFRNLGDGMYQPIDYKPSVHW